MMARSAMAEKPLGVSSTGQFAPIAENPSPSVAPLWRELAPICVMVFMEFLAMGLCFYSVEACSAWVKASSSRAPSLGAWRSRVRSDQGSSWLG